MNCIGKITKIENDTARVLVMQTSMCGENCAGCSGGCKSTYQTVEAKLCVDGAEEGDTVRLDLSGKTVLSGAAIVYLIPLAFMLAAYFAAVQIFKSEGIAILISFSAAAVSFVIAKFADRRAAKTGKYKASVTKIIAKKSENR